MKVQQTVPLRPFKSFYAGSVGDFAASVTDSIVGQLSQRIGLLHAGDERNQILAWHTQIELLKKALSSQGTDTRSWGVLVELQLLRLGRRIDTVVLIGDQIACIEFKIGANRFDSSSVDQAVDYALCLRDFHQGSRGRTIHPILCCTDAEHAPSSPNGEIIDDVAACSTTNSDTLAEAFSVICEAAAEEQIDVETYDASGYNPTPDIVSAARSIYAGHTVASIGRTDAKGDDLDSTARCLQAIAREAKARKERSICFVTGEPGSGKTLLGLDLVFAKGGQEELLSDMPSALLSGNRPLVRVLQEAIAVDTKERSDLTKAEAKRRAEQALQNLLGYLKEHTEPGAKPPEHVIVFDEAQRAWNADTGFKLLQRKTSEPELFLEILGRLDWCCLVCLVGSGQEINRGEGGLALWGQALQKSAEHGQRWTAYVSPQSKDGLKGLLSQLTREQAASLDIRTWTDLHLVTDLRSYRNETRGVWVEALLEGDTSAAATISGEMEEPPARITRNLSEAKRWLQARQRGNHRVGLLVSSGAVRLIAEGIPESPRSNELDEVVHWFLKPAGDYRSSNALEKPLSEFVCQGLEIDYTCLCWGSDLIWQDDRWIPRRMRAPKWTISRDDAIQYRLNAYRVLLTRSRAGMVIYVPKGDRTDPTREPELFDAISETLLKSGCTPV